MQPLIWDRRPDGLRAPAMVCAFEGWNDAGDAASRAVSFLASALDASRFARIDSEEFYDFQANRPCIRLAQSGQSEGGEREIKWPTVEIFEAQAPRAPRDLVLVQGVEPSMRWRAFTTHIVDLAEALGVQMVVTLGALLGDVPHTRPVGMLRKIEVLVGVSVDVSELESSTADYERQVGLAVRSDPDIQAFVERLEQAADSEEQSSPEDLPSGDILASEFQRFLRQRGREGR
jgi:hypothetical protein